MSAPTTTQESRFNPNDHLMKIQRKDYLPVRWRLVWFHQATSSRAGYITVELEHDRQAGFAKFFAIAWDGGEETWRHLKLNGIELDVCGRVATGEGTCTKVQFDSFYEKAATKALGRALAGLNFGTEFASEMDEEGDGDLADAPLQRENTQQRAQSTPAELMAQWNIPARMTALFSAGVDRSVMSRRIWETTSVNYTTIEQRGTREQVIKLNNLLASMEQQLQPAHPAAS